MTEANIPGVPAKPAVSAGLERIASRPLGLSTAITGAARSPSRKDPGRHKVGNHQASGAPMVSAAPWPAALMRDDRVSVKPPASPVLHAINFLIGELRPAQLGTLRGHPGLQSYPSRFQGPDTIDHSIASVSIGAAPQMGRPSPRATPRASPALPITGKAVLPGLDRRLNRQSLDRVVPDMRTERTTTRDEDQE